MFRGSVASGDDCPLRDCHRPGSSEERVAEFEGAVSRSVVHVLGVENGCAGTDRRFNDQGVPVADAALLNALEGQLHEGGVDWVDGASRESFNDPGYLIE